MIKKVIETNVFAKEIETLIKKRRLNLEDYDEFKRLIALQPDLGDIIVGTGGVRKARLKSTSKGKSGGFRVCYYFLMRMDSIYLIWIYAKNQQENLTQEEKGELKKLVTMLKGDT